MQEVAFTWSAFGELPDAALDIRNRVFVEEQGFQEEFDETDRRSYHILLMLDGAACGTARIFWDQKPVMRLGRLALLKPARGGGHGRAVLEECRAQARRMGAHSMVLDAQMRAKGFYEACGFIAVSDVFLEEGYPHYRMECSLQER